MFIRTSYQDRSAGTLTVHFYVSCNNKNYNDPIIKKDLAFKNEKISFLKIEGNHKDSSKRLGFKVKLKTPLENPCKKEGVTQQEDSLYYVRG